MSGVVLHAHQVSQIIRAVLDGRPLITFWSWWVEWLWIFGWCGVGSAIGYCFRRVLLFVLFIGGNIIIRTYAKALYMVSRSVKLALTHPTNSVYA
ncbi:hypothetical protein CYANOKiyG1_15280 [Okeania sp. KiyG1]|nr:hypothetical protein CYANOKiyG1_15280 [Okeania sp. KiyG1]